MFKKTKITASHSISSWQIYGKYGNSDRLYFLGLQNSLEPWEKIYDQPRQRIKKQWLYFAKKGSSSQSYGFNSGHQWMWEFDYKESWALKNWCFWTVVLEKTLESLLDSKETQPIHPKGNQSWIFGGRTDSEAEAPVLWPPDAKKWLIEKDPDVGKDWRQKEKGMTRGWDDWMASLTNGHEFEQAPGVGDGQGSLVCCSPWGCKELDTIEWLNRTELIDIPQIINRRLMLYVIAPLYLLLMHAFLMPYAFNIKIITLFIDRRMIYSYLRKKCVLTKFSIFFLVSSQEIFSLLDFFIYFL